MREAYGCKKGGGNGDGAEGFDGVDVKLSHTSESAWVVP